MSELEHVGIKAIVDDAVAKALEPFRRLSEQWNLILIEMASNRKNSMHLNEEFTALSSEWKQLNTRLEALLSVMEAKAKVDLELQEKEKRMLTKLEEQLELP